MKTRLVLLNHKSGDICFELAPKFKINPFCVYEQLLENFAQWNICIEPGQTGKQLQRLIENKLMSLEDFNILKGKIKAKRYSFSDKLNENIEAFLNFEPKKTIMGKIKK